MSRGFVDAYAVLGVPADATPAQLKAAHRRLVRRHHPDVLPPPERAAATRRVQEVNLAYGLVRDPAARRSYDRLRRAHRAQDATAEVDARLAAQWEQLSVAAGRWAAAWWRRGRRRTRWAALRARQAGLDALGRLLWLLASVAGAGVGLAVALAAQRLLGVDGFVAPLTGALGGALAGSQRGWHRRLRLAGFHVDPAAHRWGTALAGAGLVAALWADAALGG